MLGRETIRRSQYYYAPTTTLLHTLRVRSRAQHVRQREADVEGAKNWRQVHLRRSKGEARRAEPTFGVWFREKGAERGEWRGPKGRADALSIVVL